MRQRALITGVTGQDGAYLARLLLSKDYEVHGTVRSSRRSDTARIDPLGEQLTLHEVNLREQAEVTRLVETVRPQEIYNLAAQSFVPASFADPLSTADITGLLPVRLLEAIRAVDPTIRFFQASTSEMFGRVKTSPQHEATPFSPGNPYAAAKLYAHCLTTTYRQQYGLFAASGILFNHESPLRGAEFVTRKISLAVARIKQGEKTKLQLGNLAARRDWGFAGDYVECMWKILQHDTAEDFVIGTGEVHSVAEFAELAFAHVGLDWRDFVETNADLVRAADDTLLRADASKALRLLNWRPKVTFTELVAMMVDADLRRLATPAEDP